MKTTKFLTATALSLALAAPAAAQMVMMSYDVDGDGELTGAEFRNLFDDNLSVAQFDTDGDGALSTGEYEAAFGDVNYQAGEYGYDYFDADGDGILTDDEYSEGILRIFDENESGMIDGDEFTVLTTAYDGIFNQ
jgi:Ca2+-binding EF-hand superfamily protein